MILYQIRNIINNKVYVGQTVVSAKHRWHQHKSDLRRNKHRSTHLQRSWNKYGASAFEFSVLRSADSIDELNLLEENVIDEWKLLDDENGYNIKRGGDNKNQSQSTKIKLSKMKRPTGWPNIIGPDNKESLLRDYGNRECGTFGSSAIT